MRQPSRLALFGALGTASLLLAGCSAPMTTIQDLPLPGGAALGSHPYQVRAQFADALNLVAQADVRVNDVPVGRVTSIALAPDGWTAEVTMEVNGDVHLPADAYAELAQSSLLGEKFVQLTDPPADVPATGTLQPGAQIPLSRTDRAPEVEEIFGALSLLLNGGGLNQIHSIAVELNKALAGNTTQIRDLLPQLDTLVSTLNAHRQDLTNALDGVDRLSTTLAARDQQIGTVLNDLAPGLQVLSQQRGQLVTMLQSLDTLSTVADDTVNRSKDAIVADLKSLAPTLQQLADAGSALPNSLQVLATYPFTDQVLQGIKGDYLNAYLSVTAANGTQVSPIVPVPSGAPGTASSPGGQ
ncbi:MCE family protein [Streptacidiphilus fuscans]|uniref:MCE family protein n=1 Tax=Streptacidiphilus fuscans TaxID=2789292 RepID=A0A931B5B2_9ACTN|nr:MCE family protein [Streptacidiphilus fuscans]MBF9069271.1 MCE family protein [Streptacidiphilus fuscans]